MEDDPYPAQETPPVPPAAPSPQVTLSQEQYEQIVRSLAVASRMEDTISSLQQQLDTLRHLSVTPARTPSPARIVTEAPKVNPPALFSGERQELEVYLTRCEHIFLTQPGKFPSEKSKVLYASTFLDGTAYSWFIPLLHQYSAATVCMDGTIPIPPEFTAWKTYRDSLTALYGDPDLAKTKTREINALKQTTSVAAYVAEF